MLGRRMGYTIDGSIEFVFSLLYPLRIMAVHWATVGLGSQLGRHWRWMGKANREADGNSSSVKLP